MCESNGDTIDTSKKQFLQQRLIADLCQETITKLQIFQRGLRFNAPIVIMAGKKKSSLTSTLPASFQGSSVSALNFPAKKMQRKIQNESFNTTTISHSNDEHDRNILNERVLNAIKMDKELDTLIEIFDVVAFEFQQKNQYQQEREQQPNNSSVKTLKKLIDALQANNNEVDTKSRQLHQRKIRLQYLKTEIERDHKVANERIHNMDERIVSLRHNLRNVRRLNDLEFDLVQRWETNRFTQATIVCLNEERSLRAEIENLDRQITDETRIIAEVEKFNAKQFDEYRAKINEWKTKYANEMAKVTSETMEHEKRIMELSKIHERHEQTYAERVKFVRAYLERKAEEQRLHEQQMYRVECAVKLQAWWRGVMVRRGLGPYKKKAKKGKKGKAKGK